MEQGVVMETTKIEELVALATRLRISRLRVENDGAIEFELSPLAYFPDQTELPAEEAAQPEPTNGFWQTR